MQATWASMCSCRRRLGVRPQQAEPADVFVADTGDVRGKVLVSRRAFRRGEEIFREVALLSVPAGVLPLASLANLDLPSQQRLLQLHCPDRLAPARPEDGANAPSQAVGEDGEHLEEVLRQSGWSAESAAASRTGMWRMLCVWDANKLSFVSPSGLLQCVFQYVSRMNHSCEPNVRLIPAGGGPHEAKGELRVVAAVDIESGEELNICYPEKNSLPLLHFLMLPAGRRRHLLQRWGFTCACPRCSEKTDGSRYFRCSASSGCGGCTGTMAVVTQGTERLAPCSLCNARGARDAADALLAAEAALLTEVEQQLVPLLKGAATREEFPLDTVLELLGRCSEANLAEPSPGCHGHWLVFWLLSLVGVGASERGLHVAAHGVARAGVLPVLPGDLQGVALRAPPSAQGLLLAADRCLSTCRRPGLTPRMSAYLAYG